ncbi:MAG: response regulator, partial [Thermoanaerobaculia bacterium]
MAKRILLADDSLTIQKVVELTFSDSEYELVCVPNGQRALDKVAERAPDLILADVVMPEKNGYEVCEAIKANPATARIPVVLLSGTFEPFDRERAERLGCDAIVSKPFDSQQLLRQVEALLSKPQGEVPSAHTMAIPVMTNPTPPPAAEERPTTESGFLAEDFTGRIRRPAGTAGGPDLFEEEYGQADVESAIAAFEKAHPEYAYVEEGAADSAMNPGSSDGDDDEREAPGQPLSDWMHEEPQRASVPPPPPAPAPYWVPREPEPELQP